MTRSKADRAEFILQDFAAGTTRVHAPAAGAARSDKRADSFAPLQPAQAVLVSLQQPARAAPAQALQGLAALPLGWHQVR